MKLTFLFNDNANPAPSLEDANRVAKITLGVGSAAWQQLLWLTGTATGLWDLGPKGNIEILVPWGEVIVASVSFLGGTGLYGVGPDITLMGSNPDSSTEVSVQTQKSALASFAMVTRRCVWNLSGFTAAGELPLLISSPQVLPRDAFVDSVIVESLTAAEAVVANLKSQLRPVRDQAAQVVAGLDAILSA